MKMLSHHLRSVVPWFLLMLAVSCHKSTEEPEPENKEVEMTVDKFSDNWTCSIRPGTHGNFDIAEFGLWVPDPANVSAIRGILVLAAHFNSNALGLVYDKKWQEFSKQQHVALLAVHLENVNVQVAENKLYYHAANGSGQALLMALDAIAKKNNIADIATLPFLFRGYSGGGMFGYHFSSYLPERVIAFTNIRGWAMDATPEIHKTIPALFLIAELDTEVVDHINPLEHMKEIVRAKRMQHALWGYAIEPGEDHGGSLEKSDSLSRLFFASALKNRLAPGSHQLLNLAEPSGYLGNNDSVYTFPYATYPDVKTNASWLIDQEVATAWKEYQK